MLIIESAIVQEAELELVDKNNKVVYRAILQTADEVNENKRLYPRAVLEKALRDCKDDMKRRAKLGELDHPILTGNDQVDEVRQTTVLLSEASHLILDYEWRGNEVWGLMETLPTPKGKILANLLKAKTQVGTSMRGFAELETSPKGSYKIVQDPLVIITYDMVQRPSHSKAVVKEIKFEHLEHIRESSSGNIVCTSDGKCYLSNYFDKIVEMGIIRFKQKWF